MRITNSHRGHTTNLAKCTKMTEGEHRIHGMNGVTDSGSAAAPTSESPHSSDAYNLGGRLKFFKNGRFILELARAREGEKVAWVPVPKKTFWPPQGSASSVSTYRQESSTSLSVSDDNSSVQSSPWQRDHTWKQTSPQRNASTHLTFYFFNRQKQRLAAGCWRHRLPRAPYSPEPLRTHTKCNSIKCVNKSAIPRASLPQIVQILLNKSLHALNSVTSPRKRILRELERVTIDDLSYKRCRGKVNHIQQVQPAPAKTSMLNGNVEELITTASAKNCSYSITSLLGNRTDIKEEKLSSQKNETDAAAIAQTLDTVDGPTSDILLTNRPSPPTDNFHHSPAAPAGPPQSHAPYPTPYMPPYSVYPLLGPTGYVPPYYSASPYYSGFLPPPITHHSWNAYHSNLHSDDSDVPLNLSKHAD